MRPSIPRFSNMPGRTKNVWWGDKANLVPQKGVIQYTLSPFFLRAAPHMFRDYLFNGYRRLSHEFPYWAIPFGMGYATYTWANETDFYRKSKASVYAGERHED
ncbi:cytochrome b-c1 complex subunit 8 [Lyophyllum atratum]|nr:cytochrome b-c1 complex subunit 8 [Lyophyllum atratum]